jgi:hypothetical protein
MKGTEIVAVAGDQRLADRPCAVMLTKATQSLGFLQLYARLSRGV